MYKYVRHKYIDYKLWDDCIEDSSNGNLYTLSWYLNIVSPGWDAIIKEDQDKYMAVFPVTHDRKFGIKYLRQPHFCIQLGLIHRNPIIEQDLIEVLNILKAKFIYIINYPLNIDNSSLIRSEIDDYVFIKNISYEVNIDKPYEDIYLGFSKDRKNNIKKGKAHSLVIERSEDIDQLIKIFKAHTAARIYGGVREYQYNFLKKLFQEASKKNIGKIYDIKNSSGQVIASTLVFKYKNRLIKFFNASSREGRQKNADSLIMEALLQTYANQNLIFDFERGSMEGINKYKESYGPEKVFYYSISLNQLPGLLKTLKRIRHQILARKNDRIKAQSF